MKVITCVVNNPIFIEIQYNTLKKYMKNEYEYIVFNDAKDYICETNKGNIHIKREIEELCKRLGIKCINVPNDNNVVRNNRCPSTFTSYGMNFMLKYQLANPDKYIILDSDMFLIDYLDVNERYKDYKCGISLQTRNNNKEIVRYAWVGIVYMDMTRIDDGYYIDWGLNYGITDCGGLSEEWLKRQIKEGERFPSMYEIRCNKFDNYNTENVYFIKTLRGHCWTENELPDNLKKKKELMRLLKEDKRNYGELIFCELYDDIFFHYHAGSNWRGEGLEYHIEQSRRLKEVILIDVDDN